MERIEDNELADAFNVSILSFACVCLALFMMC